MIEAGMLRAVYILSDGSHSISESMVAGTVAGELSFLSRTKRNTNVVAERDSVLWKMDVDAHERMGKELGWATARKFEETVLKIAVAETEVLMVRRTLFALSTNKRSLTCTNSLTGSPHVEFVRRDLSATFPSGCTRLKALLGAPEVIERSGWSTTECGVSFTRLNATNSSTSARRS